MAELIPEKDYIKSKVASMDAVSKIYDLNYYLKRIIDKDCMDGYSKHHLKIEFDDAVQEIKRIYNL